MNRRAALCVCACLLSAIAGAEEIASSETTFSEYYAEVRKIDGAVASVASDEVTRLYDAFYPLASRKMVLVGASYEALHFLMRATASRHFYTHDEGSVSTMRTALGVLESSGKSTRADRDVYFRSLILDRSFEEAGAVQSSWQDGFPALPSIDRDHQPVPGAKVVWRVESASNTLVRQSLSLSKGRHLIVLSHPACKFSQAVMHAFASDPDLQALPTHWIIPPNRELDFDLVGNWNAKHPATPLLLMDKVSQWKFEYWSTPTFYLLQDGEVVRYREGWAIDGSDRDEVVEFIAGSKQSEQSSKHR